MATSKFSNTMRSRQTEAEGMDKLVRSTGDKVVPIKGKKQEVNPDDVRYSYVIDKRNYRKIQLISVKQDIFAKQIIREAVEKYLEQYDDEGNLKAL